MRKKHKRIRNGIVLLTIVFVIGLMVSRYEINALSKEIDYKISVEQVAVDEQSAKLAEMQRQLEEMDSLEYVREVATKELKMVEPDTIVIKPRE